jgi:PAS domain S-box-containing protein
VHRICGAIKEGKVNALASLPNSDYTLLQSLIEALPDPCIAIDSDGCVLAANRAWKELPRSDKTVDAARNPVGINYLALFPTSAKDQGSGPAVRGIKALLSGHREHFEHDYLRQTPDAFRWFRMSVRAWRQLGASALIFHRDITTEKLGRLTKETAEEEFRSLADSSPVLIWTSGPDKGCTFFNSQWLEFTGVPMDEQLGAGWVQLVHPEDRDGILRVYHLAFEENREFEFDYRLRYRDGSYRWIRDRGVPRFDSQNRLSGFIGSAWDLSDQKRATEAAEQAIRYTRLVHDVAVVAISANTVREALQRSLEVICETMMLPAAHAFLIYDDEPELAKPSQVTYAKDAKRFAALAELTSSVAFRIDEGSPGEVLRSGKPVIADSERNSSNPKRYPRARAALAAGLRASIHVPVLVDRKVEAILEFGSEEPQVSRELTDALTEACERLSRFFERRRAQISFLKQKKELEASAARLFSMAGRLVDSQEAERRRIAAEIHDDFTQRLAMVSLKISNLARSDRAAASANLDAALEDVRKSITTVADDLRELSHQLRPATLEILGLVRALQAQCEDFNRARGVETVFEASASDHDASPQVALCLYRVLQESLMNIAKHSGNARACVTLTRQADDLELRIRDEGRGFILADGDREGMGLANVRERVGLLNGKFIVNSSPGRGTEIAVRVPASPRAQFRPSPA